MPVLIVSNLINFQNVSAILVIYPETKRLMLTGICINIS